MIVDLAAVVVEEVNARQAHDLPHGFGDHRITDILAEANVLPESHVEI
jgi:hypothetical protein